MPNCESEEDKKKSSSQRANTDAFYQATLARVANSEHLSMANRIAMLNRARLDLKRLGSIEPAMRDASLFGSLYLQAQMILLKVFNSVGCIGVGCAISLFRSAVPCDQVLEQPAIFGAAGTQCRRVEPRHSRRPLPATWPPVRPRQPEAGPESAIVKDPHSRPAPRLPRARVQQERA